MKTALIPTNSIRPYEENARIIHQSAIDAVAASIKSFGFRQPIVVDKNGVIIAGHTRHLAAQQLGIDTVPVHVADSLTDEQVKAYRIADNSTGALTEWDIPALDLELAEIEIDMSEYGIPEFSADEVEPPEYGDDEPDYTWTIRIHGPHAEKLRIDTEAHLRKTQKTIDDVIQEAIR